MARILFYDTETTRLPLFKEPSDHPDQPHIVQLAAALVDSDTQKTISSINLLAIPESWVIPDEMSAIHGITTDMAANYGVEEINVLRIFLKLWCSCDFRVAFNESFDARIIRIAQHRYNPTEEKLEAWKNGRAECAMYGSRPYTNLPKNKLPKLIEAYQHFFGKGFDGAHNAMNDVNALIDVYFAIQDKKSQELV